MLGTRAALAPWGRVAWDCPQPSQGSGRDWVGAGAAAVVGRGQEQD